jgi:hypothetical protein
LNILSDGENDPYGFPDAEEEAERHNSPKKKKKGIWSKIKSSLRKGKKKKKVDTLQENEGSNTRQTRASRRHAAAL